jgi:hypothetical protein
VSRWEDSVSGSIFVNVDYYDGEHQKALENFPTSTQIQSIVRRGVEIPVEEFLTYFLFHRVHCAPSRYRAGYTAVRTNISDAFGMLRDFVKWDDGMLHMSDEAQMLPRHVTEYVGESIGLSVTNRIHRLTEADWVAITESAQEKTLDYEYASDGMRIIQLEAKGSTVEATHLKSKSIFNQKASIEAKKAQTEIRSAGALRYGTIAAIPVRKERLKCWLLDPPPRDAERAPKDLRAIARMQFLWWIVRLVSPRSQLATALATRLTAIRALREPYELSGVALTQSNGNEFPPQSAGVGQDEAHWFFPTRSRVTDGPAGGVVSSVDGRNLLFVGMRAELVDLAAAQDFDKLVEYRANVASLNKTVRCVIPGGEFQRFDIGEETLPSFSKSGGYVYFTLEGVLRYSQEGLVFGVLPIPGA